MGGGKRGRGTQDGQQAALVLVGPPSATRAMLGAGKGAAAPPHSFGAQAPRPIATPLPQGVPGVEVCAIVHAQLDHLHAPVDGPEQGQVACGRPLAGAGM